MNVEAFDRDHRKLVKLANTFLTAFSEEKAQIVLNVVLDELAGTARKHFKNEEQEMRKTDHEGFITMKDYNDALSREILMFRDTYVEGQLSAEDVTFFVKDWVLRHMRLQRKVKHRKNAQKN
jgi:hemerythrin-like metal-binding protein